MDEAEYVQFLWSSLLPYYLMTVAIETPILLVGLSPRHSFGRRVFSGFWLTACTYPIVVLVLNPLLMGRPLDDPMQPYEGSLGLYLLVAETFAPVAECALFWAAFGTWQECGKRSMWRDFATITVANLASFGFGELLNYFYMSKGT